jgi:two-component system KDP operon response regulator KdpE
MSRILVADDDPELLRMLGILLSEHEVHLAHSGYQALEFYARARQGAPFDLMIFDVAMLDMTGFQLEEAIRASGDNNAAVIFLSGHFGGRAQEEVFKANVERAVAVWKKPFEAGEFREKIHRVLRDLAGN